MKPLLTLTLLLSIAFFSGCNNDSNGDAPEYRLLIRNQLGINVEVFIDGDDNERGFESYGIIPASGEKLSTGLVIDVNYTIRASEIGGTSDDYIFEDNFVNQSTTVPQLIVNITAN